MNDLVIDAAVFVKDEVLFVTLKVREDVTVTFEVTDEGLQILPIILGALPGACAQALAAFEEHLESLEDGEEDE